MEPFPPEAAAVVGGTVITRDTFNRWFAVAAKGDRRAKYTAVVREAMRFLIQSE